MNAKTEMNTMERTHAFDTMTAHFHISVCTYKQQVYNVAYFWPTPPKTFWIVITSSREYPLLCVCVCITAVSLANLCSFHWKTHKIHIKHANLTDWRNLILFMRHRYQRSNKTNAIHTQTPSICYMLES